VTERIDNELLDAAGPSLKVVSTLSVGYDHIDVKACKSRNVAIGNTPGVLTETAADLTLALMLATARRIPESIAAVRNGEWTTWKPQWLAGYDLYGSTVGIIGLGRIGAAVAKRLRGFDCRILYTGSQSKPAIADPLGAQFSDFEAMLPQCDFMSIHAPLIPETRNLFNAAVFRKMKNSAILINTSRGGTVDQEALYQALAGGEIAGAGLDVTTPEPLPTDHPLLQFPNCVILPHIASASYATRTKMALLAAANVIAGVKGQPLPYPV
jgi:lactate dehydrogenase-like 2-hydroxyacid dehydrogenase